MKLKQTNNTMSRVVLGNNKMDLFNTLEKTRAKPLHKGSISNLYHQLGWMI